jgi:hypothetical protein
MPHVGTMTAMNSESVERLFDPSTEFKQLMALQRQLSDSTHPRRTP